MSKNLLVLDQDAIQALVAGKLIDDCAKAAIVALFPDKPGLGEHLFATKAFTNKDGSTYTKTYMQSISRMVKDWQAGNGKSQKENAQEMRNIVNVCIDEKLGKFFAMVGDALGYRTVYKTGTVKGAVNLSVQPTSMDSKSFIEFDKEGRAKRAVAIAKSKGTKGTESLRNLLGTGALTEEAEAEVLREIEAEKVS